MSPQIRCLGLRWLGWFGGVVLGLALAVVGWLPAQEAQPSAQESSGQASESKERDQRLEQIEKSLQTLLKEVQSLKAPSAATSASGSATQAASAAATKASPDFPLDAQWLKSLNWRCLGPANMGGRITDIAVNENDSSIGWV